MIVLALHFQDAFSNAGRSSREGSDLPLSEGHGSIAKKKANIFYFITGMLSV
ncbi:MAG: hypothetical protein V1904_03770 [Bacteroidota bacterium]